MIGNTIGDYRILEKRGEGGMGMFFKARDIRLDRLVGLKTIRAELLHDPEVIGRLEEEARSLARLDHPNIARLLHYMVIDDQRYIVMEYVEGSDLSDRLRHDGPLPLELMARLVPQICAAIGYAHNRHVIHRDIKPSNILLTEDGTVKVTDFGIAKILGVSTKTRTGVATGSLPYMAPEQIRGKVIDARTDIYQSGVMLYELIAGRRPFLAKTEYDMMSHHLSTPPPVPSSLNSSISTSLDRVLLKALEKAPQDRFQSTDELAAAFSASTSKTPGVSSQGYKRSATAPPGNSTRLQTSARWILAVGILVIAAVSAFFGYKAGFENEAPLQEVRVRADMPVGLPKSLDFVMETHVEYSSRDEHKRIYFAAEPPTSRTFSFITPYQNYPGEEFITEFVLNPADSVQFRIRAFDSLYSEVLLEGEVLQNIVDIPVGHVVVVVPMTYALARNSQSTASPIDTNRAIVDLMPVGVVESGIDPEQGHNRESTRMNPGTTLTLDVQPFAERERIEALSIDGRKQTGEFPLELIAPKGLRVIRWQIGSDYWTDTVSVADSPVQKTLMFDLSPGRINVTVTFPDGPGYAEILLDGQETGVGTPGELRNVASGPHEITLRRAGYRMQGGPVIVRVPANDRVRVAIPMGPR